jgi:hypothetical protein
MGKGNCPVRAAILDTIEKNAQQANSAGVVKRTDPQVTLDQDVYRTIRDGIAGNIEANRELEEELRNHEAACDECTKGD